MERRVFLSMGVSVAAMWARGDRSVAGRTRALGGPGPSELSIKAIVFDAFPIFDPRPIAVLAGQLFPGRGGELMKEWRTRQFEDTWLRSMEGNYTDFLTVTSESLDYAVEVLKMDVSPQQRRQLVDGYLTLPIWPEVLPVLDQLRRNGYRLGFLSNFTSEMLRVNADRNGVGGYFEHLLSVDRVRKFKPDPLTYEMGMDVFGLKKEEILFAAFAGWDAVGAKRFGYTTFWVNRLQTPSEHMGVLPDGEGRDLKNLYLYLSSLKNAR